MGLRSVGSVSPKIIPLRLPTFHIVSLDRIALRVFKANVKVSAICDSFPNNGLVPPTVPHQIQRISIFVAGSSDVQPERQALKDIIQRLNHLYDRRSVHLQLINWQDNVVPDFGLDPQDVINRQIRFDGIDIFLGIIWRRVGTVTPRALSGTIEEVNQALAARHQTGRPWRIMFFLSDLQGGATDSAQTQAVEEFRSWLQQNALCKRYQTLEQFRDDVRDALAMAVDDYLLHQTQWHLPPPPTPQPLALQWADQFTYAIACPWCGPLGHMNAQIYQLHRGQVWPCPRCAMPQFFQ